MSFNLTFTKIWTIMYSVLKIEYQKDLTLQTQMSYIPRVQYYVGLLQIESK
jgi:hypothetical protein